MGLSRKNKVFLPIAIFAFAMGILEAIVVVYLRQLYYPQGFEFPLMSMPLEMVSIEILREACTIVMLGAIAYLSKKKWLHRFCIFIFTFAVWDISYYIGLKFLLGWPQSLLTWDLLFLIPLPWISPVIAPIICSLVMILFAVILYNLDASGYRIKFRIPEIILIIAGPVLVFISFIWNYSRIIFENSLLPKFLSLAKSNEFQEIIAMYKPRNFKWEIFIVGVACGLVCLIVLVQRAERIDKSK